MVLSQAAGTKRSTKRLLAATFLLAALGALHFPALAAEKESASSVAPAVSTSTAPEEAFAREFIAETSTSALYEVFDTTAPEHAVVSFLRRGVYRTEFLVLFAIGADSKTAMKALVQEREKGTALRVLASRYGLDLMKLFREAGSLQERIEAAVASREKTASSPAPVTEPGLSRSTSAVH